MISVMQVLHRKRVWILFLEGTVTVFCIIRCEEKNIIAIKKRKF